MILTTPNQLMVVINTKGMFLDTKLYATKDIRWADLLKHQIEHPTIDVLVNLFNVASILQIYIDKVFKGASVAINSGWRSEAYNLKIGGAKESQHVLGKAIDFCVAGLMPLQVYKMLDSVHFGGLERADTWTHCDIRGYNARFNSQNVKLSPHFSVKLHTEIVGSQDLK